jgi:hypothetical protein
MRRPICNASLPCDTDSCDSLLGLRDRMRDYSWGGPPLASARADLASESQFSQFRCVKSAFFQRTPIAQRVCAPRSRHGPAALYMDGLVRNLPHDFEVPINGGVSA